MDKKNDHSRRHGQRDSFIDACAANHPDDSASPDRIVTLRCFAERGDKPAVAPLPRTKETINLTEEQRHIIKENVKYMAVPKAPANAPETIGDVVPLDIKLSQLPPLAGKKVAQARSHLLFVKEGNDAIVLVSPDDRRVADVIQTHALRTPRCYQSNGECVT